MTKLSKAFLAAGLSAALVGCGGGGSETAQTGNGDTPPPTAVTTQKAALTSANATLTTALAAVPAGEVATPSQLTAISSAISGLDAAIESTTAVPDFDKLEYRTNLINARNRLASLRSASTAHGTVTQYREKLTRLQTTAEGSVNTVNIYLEDDGVVDRAIKSAETGIEDLKTEIGKAPDGFDTSAYEEKRKDLKDKLDKFKTDLAKLRTKNADVMKMVDAFGDWNRVGLANLVDAPNTVNPITVTTNFGDTTSIAAGSIVRRAIPSGDQPGGIWKGARFNTNSDGLEFLKVFTSHGGSNNSERTEWEEFWVNDGHYEQSEIFGSGDANVIFQTGTADFDLYGTGSNVTGTANRATIRTDDATTTAPTVLTKIHKNDVDIRSAPTSRVILTGTRQRVRATQGAGSGVNVTTGTAIGSLTGDNRDNDSKFLDVASGHFACVISNGNADTACGLHLDPDGFIIVSLYDADLTNNTGDSPVTLPDNATARLVFISENSQTELKDEAIATLRPDTTYMTMGYWLDENGGDFTIDTFARARYWYGSNPKDSQGLTPDIGRVSGEAKYTGESVGVYVLNTRTETNEIDLHRGEFTAEANLTADFGRSVSNNDNPFVVKGTISDFKQTATSRRRFGSHQSHLDDWTLDLMPSTVNTPGGAFNGATTGGGEWQGQFYGNVDNGEATASTADDYPHAVVGEYKGDFGNYNQVIGVFGAEKN